MFRPMEAPFQIPANVRLLLLEIFLRARNTRRLDNCFPCSNVIPSDEAIATFVGMNCMIPPPPRLLPLI